MFRASLGKLGDYPRIADFDATVSLSTDATAILGEPMDVHYKFQHNSDPSAAHTSMDWIGIFRVRSTLAASGARTGSPPVSALNSRSSSITVSSPSALPSPMLPTPQAQSSMRVVEDALDFGDGPASASEELVGWSLVPEENEGSVRFEGIPARPGLYHIRYFLRGSQCRLVSEECNISRDLRGSG